MVDTELANNKLEPLLIDSEIGIVSGLQYKNRDLQKESNAPLTLILHGAGGGARSLAKLAQQLSVQGSLLIPDLNGYGQT